MKTNYYPKLDNLRAIAVLLVIVSHWFSSEHFLNRYTSNGAYGVTLFFVLSGFLITGILLDYKSKIQAHTSSLKVALRIFYIRRALRIFPIYYILLFILFIWQTDSISSSFGWHFFYLSNVYFWLQGSFHGSLSHFWSLAVEEQFYLLWPLLLLMIPQRNILFLFLIGVLSSMIFRFFMVTANNEMARFLLPANIDSFCIGGFFSLVMREKLKWTQNIHQSKWTRIILATVFFLFAILIEHAAFSAGIKSALFLCTLSISFGFMILGTCQQGTPMLLKPILHNRPLRFIGKISYGMYLYHNFIPYNYNLQIDFLSESLSMYFVQLLRFLELIFVSLISWYFVEQPILKMKSKLSI
jgi:peptidoglycan/LPS O-acetylase OafA/YrhL